jgi:hypothetical protein
VPPVRIGALSVEILTRDLPMKMMMMMMIIITI